LSSADTIVCKPQAERAEEDTLPRIAYYPVESIEDPELRGILDHAARHGTPRPESQAIRAHAPATLRDFWWQWERTFRNGVCEHAIKELCRVYISKTVECRYCGDQRSTRARDGGLVERDYDDLLEFERSDRYDERQRAALAYARAIAWSPDEADDALWERLHRHFSDEELVELGYFIAVTFGQQSWVRTLDIGHREVLDQGDEGLAPSAAWVGTP
jgi:alkylhydroperoxidase family enzyme